MKRILAVIAIGMLSGWTVAAQGSTSAQAGAQAGASTRTQTSAQAGKSGAQASGSGSASTSASANSGKNSADLSSGTKIDATLKNSLDAKKNKPGDRVEARTTQDVKQDGKVILKSGTPLIGHVTEAQARTNEQSQSQLGIVFDHAVLKGGQEVPLNATIRALAAAQSSADTAIGSDEVLTSGGAVSGVSSSSAGGGGLVGGLTSTASGAAGATGGIVNTAASATGGAGGTLNAATRSTGAVGGLTSAGRLTSDSSGVFGLQGLSINSAASNATQGSMIVSTSKNVHLDGGTQMLLSVAGEAH